MKFQCEFCCKFEFKFEKDLNVMNCYACNDKILPSGLYRKIVSETVPAFFRSGEKGKIQKFAENCKIGSGKSRNVFQKLGKKADLMCTEYILCIYFLLKTEKNTGIFDVLQEVVYKKYIQLLRFKRFKKDLKNNRHLYKYMVIIVVYSNYIDSLYYLYTLNPIPILK